MKNLKSNLVFASIITALISCTPYKAQVTDYYEGKDIRKEFLETQSGSYVHLRNVKADGQKQTLNIEPNGRFERPVRGTFSSPETHGDLKCIANHKGVVSYVQALTEPKGTVQIGNTTYGGSLQSDRNFYVVLDSDIVEVESANLVRWVSSKYTPVENQDEILAPASRKALCEGAFRREVIFLKDFAPGYLHLNDSTDFYLEESKEWIWIATNATKDLVREINDKAQGDSVGSRLSTLTVQGQTVATGTVSTSSWAPIFKYSTKGDELTLDIAYENLSTGVSLGTIKGMILGSSYNQKTGDLLVKFADARYGNSFIGSHSVANSTTELFNKVVVAQSQLEDRVKVLFGEGAEGSHLEFRIKNAFDPYLEHNLDIRTKTE